MISLTKEPETKIPITKNQPRYGLVAIHIFCTLANVVPMKERNSASVLSALKKSLKKIGIPMSICSDNDGAFMSVVKEFLDGDAIQRTTTLTPQTSPNDFLKQLGIRYTIKITPPSNAASPTGGHP